MASTKGEEGVKERASKCPVNHEAMRLNGGLSTSSTSPADRSDLPKGALSRFTGMIEKNERGKEAESGCPVQQHRKKKEDGKMYDVYGQEIDPSNMMPTVPNVLPSPGQKTFLSTDREKSGIPKSGAAEGETWLYPSPQMFFNSLKRKGKFDGVVEEDIVNVVAAHNAINEKTWKEIEKWEDRFHCNECRNPKLKKLLARPDDLSPSAYFRMWLRGYSRPFDRHDWTVDRCGKDVRYIIDYYDDPKDIVQLHVRPAMDSFEAIWDRFRSRLHTVRNVLFPGASEPDETYQDLSLLRTESQIVKGEGIDPQEFESLRNLTVEKIQEVSATVRNKCAEAAEAAKRCKITGDCSDARIAWEYCAAKEICPDQAQGFMHALEKDDSPEEVLTLYSGMVGCMERFGIMSRRVLAEAAKIKQQGPEFPAAVGSVREESE